jgi:anti-sigma factor RsiW
VSTKHSQQAPTDLELMLYADDELPPEEARSVAAWIASHPDARAKVEAIRQMGEVVRTYVELEADQAEPRLEDTWSAIARSIRANGRPAEEMDVPATRRQKTLPRPETASEGAWARIRGWFGEHRGHVITGVVTAGAVAVLMFFMGPRERVEQTTVRSTTVGGGVPAALESQPPEVEDLEVYEGSGTILTIEPEGDDDSGAAVIWISNDEDEITEDPI